MSVPVVESSHINVRWW